MFARVIVDIVHSNVDKLFTYNIPDGMHLEAGHHVKLPFGRGNSIKEGFVLEITSETPNIPVKDIGEVIESYPIFTQQQLELAYWIKKSYHCLLVDALRLMIPVQLRGGRIKEKTSRLVQIADGLDIKEARKSLLKSDGTPQAPRQYEIFEMIAAFNAPVLARDIFSFFKGSQSAVASLIKKGILSEGSHTEFRRPSTGMAAKSNNALVLNDEQSAAVTTIKGSFGEKGTVFLLHGVTGSGKTEVYMHAIQQCLDNGKDAILLVPEISLTPQTTGRFVARFGDTVAVLHSRLSAGERFDEWRRIRMGIAHVVVGARSAVFAPLQNLGIIVIDEEHEQSYLSEASPRYQAIEVAAKRCELANAPLILGSATPSMQSYLRAKTGRYRLLELNKRVNGKAMPAIEVIDMRTEFALGNSGIFSSALHSKLADCIAKKNQAILFINRRGYSTFVSCRGCGHVFKCENCDVSTTYHKSEERVKCHYCGYSAEVPKTCPECGKPYIKYFGVGTQQVEEQLKNQFPGIRVLRMDRDSTQGKDKHEEMLSAFSRGEADVLIGTQMVAKGLDFPNVTLVGVVAADSSLYLSDYRSAERTFQLITQVAGRAGRDEAKGVVVVQTYSPGHPCIRFAKTHDYKGFYAYEINQRKAALFPPFSLFVRVLLQGYDEESLKRTGVSYAKVLEGEIIKALNPHEDELLYICASPSPIFKREGVFRYQVLIKLKRTEHTRYALNAVYSYMENYKSELFSIIEINPSNLL